VFRELQGIAGGRGLEDCSTGAGECFGIPAAEVMLTHELLSSFVPAQYQGQTSLGPAQASPWAEKTPYTPMSSVK
jgi:hypothetical protein